MKKTKRILAVVLAAMLSISIVGCSNNGGANNSSSGADTNESKTESKANAEPVTLKIWGGVPEEAGPNKSCEEFNKAFADKGYKAEYVRFVNDDTGNLKLETTLLSGEGVDVFISYGLTPVQKRVDGNMVLDITDLCKRDNFDLVENFGELANNFKVNGKDYCVPTKADLYGMVLNADMFEDAGIPIPTKWTYSEFREISKQLTKGEGDSKVYGTYLATPAGLDSFMYYFGNQAAGADWMYKEGGKETNFDDPIFKQSLQFFYDLMNTDKSAPSHVDSVTQKLTLEGMFLTGKTAMVTGPWIVRSIKDKENYPHDFKTAFAPYPVPDNAEIKYSQGGAGDLVSISSKSKNPEAAWEYVKWYSTEGMLPMVAGGRVPLYKNYDADEVAKIFVGDVPELLDEATVKSVLVTPRENYALQTITTKAPELSQMCKEEVEAVFNDKKTIDDAIASMKTRGDEMLAK